MCVCVCVLCRFSTIFIPELVAFSVAMHMTYLPTPGPLPAEFATVGTTLMTMFKLMLGLSDVDVLYEAPEQWLAILLFVLYVLLTYSLMLNALIALMSNTCSIVSQNRVNYCTMTCSLLLNALMSNTCSIVSQNRVT